MIKRPIVLLVGCLLLILAPVFVACGAPPQATTSAPATSAAPLLSTAAPAPVLTDIHSPADLKARFNQDAGVPRIILLVSPT